MYWPEHMRVYTPCAGMTAKLRQGPGEGLNPKLRLIRDSVSATSVDNVNTQDAHWSSLLRFLRFKTPHLRGEGHARVQGVFFCSPQTCMPGCLRPRGDGACLPFSRRPKQVCCSVCNCCVRQSLPTPLINRRQLSAVARPHAHEQLAHVAFDGFHADVQPLRNLGVRPAAHHLLKYVALAAGEGPGLDRKSVV